MILTYIPQPIDLAALLVHVTREKNTPVADAMVISRLSAPPTWLARMLAD